MPDLGTTTRHRAKRPRPASHISIDEVEERVVRFFRLEHVLPNRERAVQRVRSMMPGYLHDRADLNAQWENHHELEQIAADDARRREWSTRAALDDWDEVKSWLDEYERVADLSESDKVDIRSLRRRGLSAHVIAGRLGLRVRDVARVLGLKRGADVVEVHHLPLAAFCLRVSIGWDWVRLGRADSTDAEAAAKRWAGIVNVLWSIANGTLGGLYVEAGE